MIPFKYRVMMIVALTTKIKALATATGSPLVRDGLVADGLLHRDIELEIGLQAELAKV
jgi:hypothetical protein